MNTCAECGRTHDTPNMMYKGVGNMCKECYALFLAVNRAMMGAHW